MVRAAMTRSRVVPTQAGPHFSTQESEIGLQEELPELRRECARVVEDPRPAVLPTRSEIIAAEANHDDRLQVRGAQALQELVMTKAI